MNTKKLIFERTLASGNNSGLWFAGLGPSNVKIADNGEIRTVGRKDLANATVQNPIFFSNNLEYAYGYAESYAGDGDGYIGVMRVKDMRSVNVLDMTDKNEFKSIFPDSVHSANFYELFKDAEPYFGFNAGSLAEGTQSVQPRAFILARIILAYRYQTKLGMTFNDMYKAFSDNPRVISNIKNSNVLKNDKADAFIYTYDALNKKYPSLDQLILNDNLRDVDFSVPFTINEYTDIYNAYVYAVFKHSIKIDGNNELVKDKQGRYVLTYYDEVYPDDKRSNVNTQRPVGRNPNAALSKDHGKLSRKILRSVIPIELTPDDVKKINYYLQITEELHKWYKNATDNKETGLSQKLKEITDIIQNNDSEKNVKAPNFKFVKGTASKYIDNLQYMLFYVISRHANKFDGCYAPEVLAVTQTNKRIDSKDGTIFLWNTDNIEFIGIYDYRKFSDIIKQIDTANAANDTESPFYTKGVQYNDDINSRIYNIVKNNIEHSTDTKSKSPDSETKKSEPDVRQRHANTMKTDTLDRYEKEVNAILNDEQLDQNEKDEKLKVIREKVKMRLQYYRKTNDEFNQKRAEDILKKTGWKDLQSIKDETLTRYEKEVNAILNDEQLDQNEKDEKLKVIREKVRKRLHDYKKYNDKSNQKRAEDILKKAGLTVQRRRSENENIRYALEIMHDDNLRPDDKIQKIQTRKSYYQHMKSMHGKPNKYQGYSPDECNSIIDKFNVLISYIMIEKYIDALLEKQDDPVQLSQRESQMKFQQISAEIDKIPADLNKKFYLEYDNLIKKFNKLKDLISNIDPVEAKFNNIINNYYSQFERIVNDKTLTVDDMLAKLKSLRSTISMKVSFERNANTDNQDRLASRIQKLDAILTKIKSYGEMIRNRLKNKKPSVKILWLDDMRNPEKYLHSTDKTTETFKRNKKFYDDMFKKYDITFDWVRSFDEFTDYILKNGLPKFISFDYDLGKDAKKGSDCARWLVQYCDENNWDVPKYFIHSANRNGAKEIESVLTNS